MSVSKKSISFHCENIHLDDGTMAAGEIACAPNEPLVVSLGQKTSDSVKLPTDAHIALGRFDPHVHFREAVIPSKEQYEECGYASGSYEDVVNNIKKANGLYSIRSGCLAALHGGVTAVGAMGNTPWGPVGEKRHKLTQSHYSKHGDIPIVVWPRMEPDAPSIAGHEGKDFGSTFGGSGLTGKARADMYKLWRGQAVSYHNDQARSDETLQDFKDRENPDQRLLHHQYFNGDTVLACQKETMEIAKEAGLSSLLARHISTGPALQQIADAAKEMPYKLPAEIGLDYVYWNQERLLTQKKEIALINYRRPAHPTKADQQSLIELTRDLVRSDYAVFFGTDHAPHPIEAKAFKDGLPGSPGTRNIEHSLQFYLELVENYGYSWFDIDKLASINPAKHMAQFFEFSLEVGTMQSGAMANLTIFNPNVEYTVKEGSLKTSLEDPYYHSALIGESGLRGKTLFTVSNGTVWEIGEKISKLN
ncbi:amidohydrolase family protein [Puniceicoccaceae bacterium K14]|nr:amidohydrolase family protein [Puniceicoccaceae bacterium K14]